MARTFVDEGLMTWEAYAASGDYGFADGARIIFHCLSDPGLRARVVRQQGTPADAERVVADAPTEALRELFADSEPLA